MKRGRNTPDLRAAAAGAVAAVTAEADTPMVVWLIASLSPAGEVALDDEAEPHQADADDRDQED